MNAMSTECGAALNLLFQKCIMSLSFHIWKRKRKLHWFPCWVDAVHLTILSFAVDVLAIVKGSLFIFLVSIFLYHHWISTLTSLFRTNHCIIFPPSYWQPVMQCSCRNLSFIFLSFIFPYFSYYNGSILFFFPFMYFIYIVFYFSYHVLLFPVLWQHAVSKTPVAFWGFLCISQHWMMYIILGANIFLRFLLIIIF